MKDDQIFSLNDYRDYLIRSDYPEELATKIVNLKIKHSVLGIIGKDDRVANKKKTVVRDLIEHLDSCLNLY